MIRGQFSDFRLKLLDPSSRCVQVSFCSTDVNFETHTDLSENHETVAQFVV